MLVRRLSEMMTGWVSFSVRGGFASEFLSRCAALGIQLLDMRVGDGVVTGKIPGSNDRVLRRAITESGMDIVKIQTKGLPTVLYRYRHRWGIPVGIVCGAILLFLMTNTVWNVKIMGCERLHEAYLLSWCEREGIKKGVWKSTVDLVQCRTDALRDMEYLQWISVYFDGCTAIVDIRERVLPEEVSQEQCSNLVAARDGEIIRADIISGESQIKIGQPVVKGDLLAGGVVLWKNGLTHFVRAGGTVIARTRHCLQSTYEYKQNVRYITKEKHGIGLYLFGLYVPIFRLYNKTAEVQEHFLAVREQPFPLGYYTLYSSVNETATVTADKRSAYLNCYASLARQETELRKTATVTDREVNVYEDAQGVHLTAEYICEEDIGEERIVVIDKE